MNHYSWIYVAGEGKSYKVGLFHSNKSGHVLIYVVSKIVVIDFNVFDSKEYTFFIEEELCKVKMERRGLEMFYTFEIDKKADTPQNRARRFMERRFFKQMVAALAFFVLVIAIFTWWAGQNTKLEDYLEAERLLTQQGKPTVGKVIIQPNAPTPDILYHFVANNRPFTSESGIELKPVILLKNGMPLQSGDEFEVLYVPTKPEINRIDFDRPTPEQLALYQKRAAEKYAALHPDEASTLIACKVKVAYELKGIGGLADFYFQDVPAEQNPVHNSLSFMRLVRDLPFKNKVEKDCW